MADLHTGLRAAFTVLLRELTTLLALETRETSSNGTSDPFDVMLSVSESPQIDPEEKELKLTIQHILELLGLIQTDRRLNIIYKWKKIQFVMRGKTDKHIQIYNIYS